ncbi:MAG: GyrI-like domain-containing protein [bacterium]
MIKISIAVIIFLIIAFIFFMPSKNLKEYEHLRDPKISTHPGQKMLVVESVGDPNVAGKDAFGLLFKTFYGLKKSNKEMKISAPRARWPKPPDTPKNEWIGIYGLPVPETVMGLPEIKGKKPGLEAKIEFWEYGVVAEILHTGPYSEETSSIEKLYKFIADNGHKIAGPHEEEYLKGPGMFFKGNPKKYKTIIRYQVEKI